MITRLIRPRLKRLLRGFPAVSLLGPRQCGKTTLARSLGGLYYDLEQPEARRRLDLQWDEIIASRELVVLDEAQEHPEVFPRLRGAIDDDRRRNGRFLLLGSVSPGLMRKVSESLAGRMGACVLSPLLAPELGHIPLERIWLWGGYPNGGVLRTVRSPDWQKSFLTTLAERDLPHWGLPSAPQATFRLFRMLAASQGHLWNASDLSRSLGLTHPTVNSYADYLEGAFLIRRLCPWSGNVRKRLVKSPRVYWRDSGLLHALLGVSTLDGLYGQPWAGASWEGFVIEQILSFIAARGLGWEPCFFRTSDGKEIDLVLERGSDRWAVEIKLTRGPASQDLDSLCRTSDLIGAGRRVLLSRTPDPFEGKDVSSLDLKAFLKTLVKA